MKKNFRVIRHAMTALVWSLALVGTSVHADVTETKVLPLPSDSATTAATIDAANGFAFFVSTGGIGIAPNTGTIERIRLSDFSSALSFIGLSTLLSVTIDPIEGFLYSGASFGTLYKEASDFTTASTSLSVGADGIGVLAQDSSTGYVYGGTIGIPASILKISTGTTTVLISSITLPWTNATSAALDPVGENAYFASSSTVPGVVSKVNLAGFRLSTQLTLPAGDGGVASVVIDTSTGFGYAGTTDSPGKVVKFRLSDMSLVQTLVLANGENNLKTAVFDPGTHFAYFGTYTSPGQVVAISLDGFTEQTPTLILAAGENGLTSSVIDLMNDYAYFGTDTSPALLIKTDLIGGTPRITLSPHSETIVAGGFVTFTAAATGRSLAYQWQKNGSAIPGATGRSYTYGPAIISDEASTFNCTISNSSGTVTTGAAVVSVQSVVRVYPDPWRSDRNAGVPITFDGLPTNATVKIYTLSAHFVKSLQSSTGAVTWDRTNEAGQTAASGYYFYVVKGTSDQQTVSGKFAVIK